MYTETNKGFTVITNFGCNQGCKYCISKEHPLLNEGKITNPDNLDWEYLEKCISESKSPTINLSGGGDPFYDWEKNIRFYYQMSNLAKKYDKGLDIHTRILPKNSVLGLFRKVALSLEYWDKKGLEILQEKMKNFQNGTTLLRVIQVIGPDITEDILKKYVTTLKKIGVKQITFREMFGMKDAHENFVNLKESLNNKWPGVLFLPDGEYHNYYFMSNNKLYPYFFGETVEYREIWRKKYEDKHVKC